MVARKLWGQYYSPPPDNAPARRARATNGSVSVKLVAVLDMNGGV